MRTPCQRPTDLAAYYQDLAYFEGSATEGYADYAGMEQVLRPLAERRLRQIEARTDGPGRVLDFGCAGGFFLDQARQRGWQIAGVEISQPMAERAAALLQIPIAANLAELADPHGAFDVITLWEVIEHLPDPLAVLAQLRLLLKPGGWLALSTPNTGHWQALAAPDQWTSYRPPAHVLYLTEPTLRNLLEQAGFTAVQIWRSGPRPYLPGLARPRDAASPTGACRRFGQIVALVVVCLAGDPARRVDSRPFLRESSRRSYDA